MSDAAACVDGTATKLLLRCPGEPGVTPGAVLGVGVGSLLCRLQGMPPYGLRLWAGKGLDCNLPYSLSNAMPSAEAPEFITL